LGAFAEAGSFSYGFETEAGSFRYGIGFHEVFFSVGVNRGRDGVL
jgi:hypothetical protein